MNQIKAIVMTLFLFSSAQAADLPRMSADGTFPLATTSGDRSQLPAAVFAACQQAIAQWAAPYAPVEINTSFAGAVRGGQGGQRIAPLFVRIIYARDDGMETREANVACTVEANGVVAVAVVS